MFTIILLILYTHLIEVSLPSSYQEAQWPQSLVLHPSLQIKLDLCLELTNKMQRKSCQRSSSEKSKLALLKMKDHIKRRM